MKRFKRRGAAFSRIDELSSEHFGLRKTTRHGFPNSPSALAYDSETGFLMIGIKTGELRIYGRPGVEFRAVPEVKADEDTAITEIFSFGSLHQYITVHENNTVLLWQLVEEGGSHTLKVVNQFQLNQDGGGKKITTCCLSKFSGHFYIGTDGGNVYTLDVRLFELKDKDIILWEKAAGLIQSSSKDHPGPVVSIVACPSNQNKILIGYKQGIITLWNITSSVPERNFPSSADNCHEALVSLSWQHNGEKFVSAHSDSSIYFWNSQSTAPEEGPTKHYGETCAPIKKISWLNTESKPVIVFMGGLPYEDADDHNTVTVLQGSEHVALDFSSEVVDYVYIVDSFTKRVQSLIVLCEHEILAFDMEAPKCPQITKPCLYSIHASPVTCLKIYDNAPKELLQDLNEITLSNMSANEYISTSIWPITGGSVRLSDPPTFDALITGHSNGSVKIWDVTGSSMCLVLELKTASIFSSELNEADADMFSEFTWPPYRKVSSYDPYEDDPRLGIKFIEFCPHTRKLCIGGEGGQVVSFALNPMQADVRVACVRAEIFVENGLEKRGNRLRGLRDNSPLECKSDFITMPAGFQPSFCIQCIPATPVTALAFRPSWGLIAAANTKGFFVANFYTKSLILIHPTVLADGLEPRNISKVQSMRRSLRSSLRRRASVASVNEERRKIVQSLNLEMGVQSTTKSPTRSGVAGGGGRRAYSAADVAGVVGTNGPVAGGGISPEQKGHVTHLVFGETHISNDGPHVGIMASTMGSTVIRYTIDVPKNEKKFTEPSRALPAGKDYSLVHAAPIVGVFILDHDMQALPSPAEVENRVSPGPNMSPPHYAVIVTQEQIKVVSLPSMRSKRKEKFNDLIHERIFKAWIIKVKVPAAPVGASRDWNNGLCLLTTIGHLLVYSLPDLKLCYHKELFVSAIDQKAMQSIAISPSGETFHLCSFSEIERRLLCAYNFSHHTTLMPSISSSQTPQRSRDSKTRQVFAEVNPNVTSPKRAKSQDSSQSNNSSQNLISPSGSEPRSLKSESVRTRSKSPSVASGTDADKRKKLSQSNEVSPIKKPVSEIETKYDSKTSSDTLLSPKDKEVMASASAFTQVLKSRSPSLTSSSSSSDSESESDSDDDNADGTGGETFGNPAAMADFGENKELDNIIASSLQQLENARAFYAEMQEKARSKQN